MSINWYPGHMVRAKREIEENLKLVDIVTIIVDARAPLSCRNRELEGMIGKKTVLMVLNKEDLADPVDTKRYLQDLKSEGFLALATDSLHRKGSNSVVKALSQAFKPQAELMLARGRRVRPARVMVAGVPNTGKSTFLNSLVGRNLAATGARPGVTRGKQWIRVKENIEFLDTPGVMWPRIDNPEQGLRLALLDVVGPKSYNEVEVSKHLLSIIPGKVSKENLEKLGIAGDNKDPSANLARVARRKGFYLKGGEPDEEKTARFLLQEFRKGRLGRISLD